MDTTDFKVIRKLWTDYYSENEPTESMSIEDLVALEEQALIPFPYCYTFFDFATDTMLFASKSFETIYGLPPEEIYEAAQLPFEQVHPEDKPAVLKYVQRQWSTFTGPEKMDIRNRIICIENRICTRNGITKHILHQNEVVGFTGEGKPRIVLSRFIVTNTLHQASDNRYVSYFVYNRETNEIEDQHKTLISTQQEVPLTESEQRIQNMIQQGLTSKEMAGELKVSVQTVRTHRKNIRSKQREAKHDSK
ncbi:MAG TPA: LuxR C-terminal-related transcriptional regulator [Gracilimonas sp.]|nr:LuxR C-terminal-related transcriptional regulator [Gracilimonas sp.]